ncbi:MAG: hypothetical protein IKH37_09760 [Prevotella sp.]|jgi:hypothetical protein|nr:hypothetical protein [Prevotella sp.]
MKQIKLVTSVERTPVGNLAGMVRVSKTEVEIPLGVVWTPLVIKPHAQLSVSDKLEDKAVVWTAKLVFKTCGEFGDRGRWAYRVGLSNGQYRLIGTDERPYPVASVLENMPENVAENQLSEVTVTWQSPHFIPSIRE